MRMVPESSLRNVRRVLFLALDLSGPPGSKQKGSARFHVWTSVLVDGLGGLRWRSFLGCQKARLLWPRLTSRPDRHKIRVSADLAS